MSALPSTALTGSIVDLGKRNLSPIRRKTGKDAQGHEIKNTLVLVADGKTADDPGSVQTLKNLKAGMLSASSTEAVTGAQLHAINSNVTTVTDNLSTVAANTSAYLGGGADVLKGTAPGYNLISIDAGGKPSTKVDNNVGSALGSLSSSTSNVNERVNQLKSTVDSLEQNAITYDEDSNSDKTNSITLQGGDASRPVTIANVADGNWQGLQGRCQWRSAL